MAYRSDKRALALAISESMSTPSRSRVSRPSQDGNVIWPVNRPIGAHSAECSYRTFKSDRCALRALRSCAFRSALRHQPSRVPEASLPWIRCVHGLSWTLVPSRSAGTPTELSGTTHGRQSVKHLLKPKEEKSG